MSLNTILLVTMMLPQYNEEMNTKVELLLGLSTATHGLSGDIWTNSRQGAGC